MKFRKRGRKNVRSIPRSTALTTCRVGVESEIFGCRLHGCIVLNRYMTINDMTARTLSPAQPDHATLAKALGHPARLAILHILARTPGCIGGDIVEQVGLAQSTVSEHLRILKAAGVIDGQIAPPRVCYALVPGALAPLVALIEKLNAASGPHADCCIPSPNPES